MILIFRSNHLSQSKNDGKEIVEIKQAGSIVLQAKFFSEIVKKLPKDTVEIEVQSHLMTNNHSFWKIRI